MRKKSHKHTEHAAVVIAEKKTGNRAIALDALRGLAILAMVLSALIPYGQGPYGMLPSWMYHGQNPPPTHATITTLPGITWVDLVFPFFLFSMGAAIPLALSRRLEKGKWWTVLPGIVWRGVLLAAFAYFREHVSPYAFGQAPTSRDWWLALAAFAVVFPVWLRLPPKWPVPIQWSVRVLGWGLALVLLSHLRYPDNANLVWTQPGMLQWIQRADIIILVLANVSVAGSLIWLCTRNAWVARLAPVGLMVALKIASTESGWAKIVWNASAAPWLYRMEFMKYLLIVLPGTIVGDLLVSWLKSRAREQEKAAWSIPRSAMLAVLLFAFVPVCVVGLKGRWVVETTLIIAVMLLLGALLTLKPLCELDKLLARLYQWGAYWLVVGLVFEPYEGGIKKSFATISYFFVTLGLAILTLAAFTIIVERLRGRWAVAILADNGQNPLLAYIGNTNFIVPVAALTGLNGLLDKILPGLWGGVAHGAVLTFILALVVSAATRMKVFVRA